VPSDPTRRALLAAGAAVLPVLTAGCRGARALGAPPRPAGGATRLRAAIAAEEDLVARYQAVLGRLAGQAAGGTPAARATLAAILTEHQDHLRQLRSRLSPGSSLAAGSGPVRPAPAVTVPASLGTAVASLATTEQAASDRLLGEVAAVPPALAQLLASISASEATHVPSLQAAAGALG
jgi:hypothetical protein